jgi:thiosulfate/3-mercaptopyruvate sulfurtransferase
MDDMVSTDWLAARLGEPGLVILDASAHLPDAGRNPRAEFEAAHVPGALFLDLDTLKDLDSPVPAALPRATQVADRLSALGVNQGDRIVVYDDSAVRTSARAWFILRMHGIRDVAILDGGLGKWRSEGRPLESGASQRPPGSVTVGRGRGPDRDEVRSKAEIIANLKDGHEQLLDARSAGRFSGADPEIRPGMPSGHIPGSRNLPFGQVLNPDGTFKDPAGLRAAFADAGIDFGRPVVTTCGSGVTAAVLLFALHLLGKEDVALYDGSWSEWGADPATPKATGAAA